MKIIEKMQIAPGILVFYCQYFDGGYCFLSMHFDLALIFGILSHVSSEVKQLHFKRNP